MGTDQESFYRELTAQEKTMAEKGLFDFDHPNAFDAELMEKCLQVPRYLPYDIFRTFRFIFSKFFCYGTGTCLII